MASELTLLAENYRTLSTSESQDPFRPILLEDPSLPESVDRPERSKYWFKSWEDSILTKDLHEFKILLATHLVRPREGIIMIEEAGSKAVSLLKRAFPDLDLGFVYRHVARAVPGNAQATQINVAHDIRIQPIYSDEEAPEHSSGLHFDGHCSPSTIGNEHDASNGSTDLALTFAEPLVTLSRGYRADMLVKRGGTWYKGSTRISCCVLGPDLYLLLIDEPLHIPLVNLRDPTETPAALTLPRDPYDRPEWKDFNAYEALLRTFKSFSPREVLKLMSPQVPPVTQKEVTFHCLLAVSDWQSITEDLEQHMRRLQSQATESLEKPTLEALGAFRRTLAAVRVSIANNEEQMLLATGMATVRSVSRQKSQGNFTVINNLTPGASLQFNGDMQFGSTNNEANAETIDAATLLDRLSQLEDRLGVIAKTVNEEIQLFIGLVSAQDSEVMMADSKIMREDSQVMREDSQIMKQQAARTTLLTTLAVIYLPLQLITGIFGMNIKEITGDGIPRWWACLAALGAGGILTFLVYLAVKWWQWRRSQRKTREAEKDKEA